MSRKIQGSLAEEVALGILLHQGFQPIMQNFRFNRIQIDIIAIKDHSKLYYFEIKQIQSKNLHLSLLKIDRQLQGYQMLINSFQELFGYELDCFLGYLILDENFSLLSLESPYFFSNSF